MKRIIFLTVLAGFLSCTLHARNTSESLSIDFKSAKKIVLNVSVDEQPVKVDWYVDNYVKYPNRPQDMHTLTAQVTLTT